ncbi:hypothetical protein B0H12DRAFT_1075473 [Mycena haematopus]|nr:hypothetical protein B0H12DRAFT_1075473 [Mycena haematopus]
MSTVQYVQDARLTRAWAISHYCRIKFNSSQVTEGKYEYLKQSQKCWKTQKISGATAFTPMFTGIRSLGVGNGPRELFRPIRDMRKANQVLKMRKLEYIIVPDGSWKAVWKYVEFATDLRKKKVSRSAQPKYEISISAEFQANQGPEVHSVHLSFIGTWTVGVHRDARSTRAWAM